jgi:cyclic dehypoxanthinyl futalosine synthase
MANTSPAGSFAYLKTNAVARLYLDNFANIQSSWVTQGLKVGQLALLYGANDMGSLMIEENVVAEAGTVHHLSLDEIRGAIAELSYTPRQRNVHYQLLDPAHEARAIEANHTRYAEIRARACERGSGNAGASSAAGGSINGLPVIPLTIVRGDNTA